MSLHSSPFSFLQTNRNDARHTARYRESASRLVVDPPAVRSRFCALLGGLVETTLDEVLRLLPPSVRRSQAGATVQHPRKIHGSGGRTRRTRLWPRTVEDEGRTRLSGPVVHSSQKATHTSVRANPGAVDCQRAPSRALPTPRGMYLSTRRRTVAAVPGAAAASPVTSRCSSDGKLYEHAYEGVDRDAALEIAEQSHKNQARVPGIGCFYGELVVGGLGCRRAGEPEGG